MPDQTRHPSNEHAVSPFRRLSLGFKANLIIVTIFSILLTVSILLLHLITNVMMKQIGQQRVQQEAILIQGQVEQAAQLLIKDADLLSTAPSLAEIVRQEDADRADDFLVSSSVPRYFTDVDLFNDKGERLVDLDAETTTKDLKNQEKTLMELALKGKNTAGIMLGTDEDEDEEDDETAEVTNENKAEESLELLLSVGVPVFDPNTGEIVGAITAGRVMDEAFLESLVFGEEGIGILLFYEDELATSTLITPRPEDKDVTKGDVQPDIASIAFNTTAMKNAQAGETTIAEQPLVLDNVPYMLAYVPLIFEGRDTTSTSLVVLVSLESLIAFQDELVATLIVIFALLMVLAVIAISFFIHGNVTAPLRRLQTAVATIASGDYHQRVAVATEDEIGKLGHTFNTMAHQLSERNTELAHALDDARAARESAEHANTMKSKFLANMSHELRTPLNSIINFAYMVSMGLFGPVNDEQVSFLNRIHTNGQHLLGLINDILDISKIEAGRLELCIESVYLDELIHSIMSTAIGLTKDKPITLHEDVAPDLPPIKADHTRIRQVLLNLLSNAAKFTDEGTITVKARYEGPEVFISVSDTGVGIAPEDQEHIFGEFQQVESCSNRQYEGTGLGLAISKQLVEMHNGRIWVESTLGAGATFYVSLPIGEEDEEPAELSGKPLTAGTNGISVLVIDDEQSAIDIVSTYLERDGYAVYGLTDSRRALNEARRLRPHIIILDILMPHRNGWETLTDLKSDPDLASIHVILYTIGSEDQLGIHLGASAYLVKPINQKQLCNTVAQLVQHNAQVVVIDDNPDVLDIVSNYLSRINNYRVITASGGQAGLDMIAAHDPDLIILDLMMPEVDGFAVLEALDKSPETSSIPVIVLTAKDLTPEEQSYLNTRVDELVIKNGSTPEQWLERVQTVLPKGP